jgi:hypothetical protein
MTPEERIAELLISALRTKLVGTALVFLAGDRHPGS